MSSIRSMGDAKNGSSTKISFGVKKKQQRVQPTLANLQYNDDDADGRDEENAARKSRVTHFEDGAIISDDESGVKKSPADNLIIPLIKQNDWRIERLLKLKKEGKLSAEESAKLDLLTESSSSSNIENIETVAVEDEADAGITANITAEDADYEQVPIEAFGLAILRGCGWKEGEGIGLTNKRVVPLKLPPRRPKGLGLGAVVNVQKPNGKTNNSDASKGASELGTVKRNSYVKILGGAHRDCYGKVQSFDEDNASVIVELAIGATNVRVSEFSIQLVSAKEYERDAKCINKRAYDRAKRRIERRNKEEEEEREHQPPREGSTSTKTYENINRKVNERSHRSGDEKRSKYGKKAREEEEEDGRHSEHQHMWVRPELRVRFINKNYKSGRLYNEKFRVLDAADCENCTIEDTNGKTYYQVHEDWLETVIPKAEGCRVMILRGRLRGRLGIMERKDKRNEEVLVRALATDEIEAFAFDDVCEWLGTYDDDDDC